MSTPRVTKENYQVTLKTMWAIACLIEEAPLLEMIMAAERADSLGSIMDPTLYRAKGGALQEDIRMLRALRHVQLAVGEMKH